ncbi:putative inositol polyphosphate 5-phosphatase [Podosphaera aphanis]|nr:putative inositol polyphosphate 5-phosphatase [Podosphaera aphanis]
MERLERESLDGSSIKPVSSLRSHFEQMANLKTNNSGASKPATSPPGPSSNGIKGKLISNFDRSDKAHTEGLMAARGNGPDLGKNSYSLSSSARNLSQSPQSSTQLRPTSSPSPIVNFLPPRSLPASKARVVPEHLSIASPTSTSCKNSPKNTRSFRRSQSPISESTRTHKISASQPPSPPPPRRSGELRRPPPPPPTANRAQKPKINNKPISLILRPAAKTSELGLSRPVDEEASPFHTPPSSSGTPDELRSPNSISEKLSRFSETNIISLKPQEHPLENPNIATKEDTAHRFVSDPFSPRTTSDKRVNLRAMKIRSVQIPSTFSASAVETNSNIMPLSPILSAAAETRLPLTPSSKQHLRPRSQTNMTIVNHHAEKASTEPITSSPLQSSGISCNDSFPTIDSTKFIPCTFPDSSHSNRRPPYLKRGARIVSTKYETRIMDVCGDYVCTSGYHTKVWSLHDGEVIANVAHTEGVKITSVAFKPATSIENEGSQLWLGNNIGDILEFDILSQRLVGTKSNAHARREIVRIYRHYHDMWTLDDGGTLNVWAADSNGALELGIPAQSFLVPRGHTFSMVVDDELWLATGKNIRVYLPTSDNSAQFEILKRPLRQPNTGDVTSGTTISTQPELLFFGHADGKISVYSKERYVCLSVINISVYKISAMAGIAGNIWTGFSTGMIYVYDIETSPWVVKKDWSAHQGPIIKLISDASSCWSLDCAQVVTLGQDNTLRIWDGLLEDDWIETQMRSREPKFCNFNTVNALIMTWNAGASTPSSLQQRDQDATFFRNLIHGIGCPDIIVFGFQELVDLENKKTVTKSFFKSKKKDPSVQEHMSHQYRDWRDFLTRCLDNYMPSNELYHLLHTASLVGLFTCIFVRSQLRERVRNLSAAEVKRGLGGLHGNKGALVIRFIVDDTSICLINCHLAAGQSGTKDRNSDITAILETPILPAEADHNVRQSSYVGGGDGTMILDHEICILNGDLNYRIDTMSRDTVVNAVKANNIGKLLERDQLLASKRKNPLFKLRAFHELPITFSPTYKYDVGTDTYDTSEKKRSPAWCDRILFRGADRIEQLDYRRHEVRVSDHRPVSGSFKIVVKNISPNERVIQLEDVQRQYLRRKAKFTNQAIQEYLTKIIGYDSISSQQIIQRLKGP